MLMDYIYIRGRNDAGVFFKVKNSSKLDLLNDIK